MRRIDVLGIGLGLFVVGGLVYAFLMVVGLDKLSAGVWSQAALVIVMIAWLGTYLLRASTQSMTYNQQLKDYEDAVLQKRLDAMTPEQLAQLEAELSLEAKLKEDIEDSEQLSES